MNNNLENIFSSGKINNLNLRNRIIKAGCFEGMSKNGGVENALIYHHREIAAGGVAMTTVAYCSVSKDGRAFDHEMWMREEIVTDLKRLTQEVRKKGALTSIQLGHCGYFAHPKVIKQRPLGPSKKFNLFRLSYCKEMTGDDIEEKIDDFVTATEFALKAGFDAIELHAGHGYLISQFISPFTNRRKDKYGGNLINRMRFPSEIIRRIRQSVGEELPILVKMNLYDGVKNGLMLSEAVEVAKIFEDVGANALIPSSGFTSKTPFLMLRGKLPIKGMIANQDNWATKIGLLLFGKLMVKEYKYTPLFHLDEAKRIVEAVKIPVIYIGGCKSVEEINRVLEAGFDFVQLGRALIHDPQLVNNLKNGIQMNDECDHCNRCVAAMDKGGVHCVSKKLSYI